MMCIGLLLLVPITPNLLKRTCGYSCTVSINCKIMVSVVMSLLITYTIVNISPWHLRQIHVLLRTIEWRKYSPLFNLLLALLHELWSTRKCVKTLNSVLILSMPICFNIGNWSGSIWSLSIFIHHLELLISFPVMSIRKTIHPTETWISVLTLKFAWFSLNMPISSLVSISFGNDWRDIYYICKSGHLVWEIRPTRD